MDCVVSSLLVKLLRLGTFSDFVKSCVALQRVESIAWLAKLTCRVGYFGNHSQFFLYLVLILETGFENIFKSARSTTFLSWFIGSPWAWIREAWELQLGRFGPWLKIFVFDDSWGNFFTIDHLCQRHIVVLDWRYMSLIIFCFTAMLLMKCGLWFLGYLVFLR